MKEIKILFLSSTKGNLGEILLYSSISFHRRLKGISANVSLLTLDYSTLWLGGFLGDYKWNMTEQVK